MISGGVLADIRWCRVVVGCLLVAVARTAGEDVVTQDEPGNTFYIMYEVHELGGQKTTSAYGSHMLVPRPNMREMPEICTWSVEKVLSLCEVRSIFRIVGAYSYTSECTSIKGRMISI